MNIFCSDSYVWKLRVLCLLAIAFTGVMSRGLSDVKSASLTAVGPGVKSVAQNMRDVALPLQRNLKRVLNETLEEIRNEAFEPVDEVVASLDNTVDQGLSILNRANATLKETGMAFEALRNIFAILNDLASQNSAIEMPKIPSPDDVPEVNGDTGSSVGGARESLEDFSNKISDLSASMNSTRNQINDSNPTIQDVYKTVDDTVATLLNMTDSIPDTVADMKIDSYINTYWAFVRYSNQGRLGIVFFLTMIAIVLSFFWFLAVFLNRAFPLMLAGFWWAAVLAWFVLIIAAFHLIFYVPVKDVCHNRNDLIRAGLNQFVFKDSTNYSATFSLTSPPEAVATVNMAVSKFLKNPDLLLDCKGESSLVTIFDIDVPSLINVRGRLDEAKDMLKTETQENLNVSRTIADMQPTFRDMEDNMHDVQANISDYHEKMNQFSQNFSSFFQLWTPSSYWNASSESRAMGLLNDINDYVQMHSPPYTWQVYSYANISDFDPSIANVVHPGDPPVLQAKKDGILGLIQLNATVSNVTLQMQRWESANENLSISVDSAEHIVQDALDLVQNAWQTVNDSITLEESVLDVVFRALDGAAEKAVQIMSVKDLGKCKVIGDFYRKAIKNGICGQIKVSLGGVALCLFLLALLWFFSWPIVLSSKTFFAEAKYGSKSKKGDDDFFEVEMRSKN